MSNDRIPADRVLTRRQFVGAGVATVGLAALVRPTVARAEDPPENAVKPGEGNAATFAYVHDASTSSHALYQAGRDCSTCIQWKGGDAAWGECAIFPNQVVAKQGWCLAWAAKPG